MVRVERCFPLMTHCSTLSVRCCIDVMNTIFVPSGWHPLMLFHHGVWRSFLDRSVSHVRIPDECNGIMETSLSRISIFVVFACCQVDNPNDLCLDDSTFAIVDLLSIACRVLPW